MSDPDVADVQRLRHEINRRVAEQGTPIESLELGERMYIAQEQLRKLLGERRELTEWARPREFYTMVKSRTRQYMSVEEAPLGDGRELLSESTELFEIVQDTLLEVPDLHAGARYLAEDYYTEPDLALLIACVASADVWPKSVEEALHFLQARSLPESMSRWVAELLVVRAIGEELGRTVRLPRRVRKTLLLSEKEDSPPVFEPPPVASPQELERAIEDFYKAAEKQTKAKYLALAPRNLNKQEETVRQYVDWLYVARVGHVSASKIALHDRRENGRKTQTNDVNTGIRTVLAYLDGKSP